MGGSCGFTLAEILIVLGIIGLIADMTIPTLISKTQEKVAVARLQKAYSTFESAFRLAIAANGTPDEWGMTNGLDEHNPDNPEEKSNSSGIVLNNIAPYLKLLKNCGQNSGCFPTGYRYLNGTPTSQDPDKISYFAKAQLADGATFFVDVHSPNCSANYGNTPALKTVCGSINVDINGFNSPNQNGVDKFIFWYTKNGIIPLGTEADLADSFNSVCRDKSTAIGNGCTAWVIYNGNMDYLHCNDLSWSGKTKCN